MSSFRPAAKVASPDGREWEIYAYKVKVRAAAASDRSGADARVLDLVFLIPRLLLRLVQIAVAGVRTLRSDEWAVDAISYLPSKTVFRWTTTTEFKGQVIAQVEGHLARGDIPQRLTNAVFRSEQRRSS